MADTKEGNQDPVKDTQEAAVPPANEENLKTEDTSVQKTEETKQSELPDEASERTRREFDKLKDQYRQEREKREYYEAVFNSLETKSQSTQVPQVYDPETGLINEEALSQTQRVALEAQERARRAEAAIQQYQWDQENREVFKSHPELDPNGEKFSQELHDEASRLMFHSMVKPETYNNKQLSFMEAAVIAKGKLGKSVEEAKAEGAKEAIENLTPKEQASLEATGSHQRAVEVTEEAEAELRARARGKGDDATLALTELLARRRIGSSS